MEESSKFKEVTVAAEVAAATAAVALVAWRFPKLVSITPKAVKVIETAAATAVEEGKMIAGAKHSFSDVVAAATKPPIDSIEGILHGFETVPSVYDDHAQMFKGSRLIHGQLLQVKDPQTGEFAGSLLNLYERGGQSRPILRAVSFLDVDSAGKLAGKTIAQARSREGREITRIALHPEWPQFSAVTNPIETQFEHGTDGYGKRAIPYSKATRTLASGLRQVATQYGDHDSIVEYRPDGTIVQQLGQSLSEVTDTAGVTTRFSRRAGAVANNTVSKSHYDDEGRLHCSESIFGGAINTGPREELGHFEFLNGGDYFSFYPRMGDGRLEVYRRDRSSQYAPFSVAHGDVTATKLVGDDYDFMVRDAADRETFYQSGNGRHVSVVQNGNDRIITNISRDEYDKARRLLTHTKSGDLIEDILNGKVEMPALHIIS